MPLTDRQRSSFFKLARRAYVNQGNDLVDFNTWRKDEMVAAGLPDSVKKCSKIIGYDTLMLHFAELAYDMDKVEYFQANEERFLRFIIGGLVKDMKWLFNNISAGRQCFAFSPAIDDAPAKALRPVMQRLGCQVCDLCREYGIHTRLLPTAGKPYSFRGKRAAAFAAYIGAEAKPNRKEVS